MEFPRRKFLHLAAGAAARVAHDEGASLSDPTVRIIVGFLPAARTTSTPRRTTGASCRRGKRTARQARSLVLSVATPQPFLHAQIAVNFVR